MKRKYENSEQKAGNKKNRTQKTGNRTRKGKTRLLFTAKYYCLLLNNVKCGEMR